MNGKFDIIDYLSGLTAYVFDVSVLRRVAMDCGVYDAHDRADVSAEQRDMCKIELLETLVLAPYQSASQLNRHGDFQTQTGSQMLTNETREAIRAELRSLYRRHGMEERLESLNESVCTMSWVDEGCC